MAMANVKIRRTPATHYPFKNVPLGKHRVGRMGISERVILDWLQFPKARIRDVVYEFGVIYITLEGREMPEVIDGNAIPPITPTYIATYDKRGRIKKVKRQKLND